MDVVAKKDNELLVEELKSQSRVISLYDICKILNKEHSKALSRVKEIQKQDGFGEVVKETIAIPRGNKGGTQNIETYVYTKKQALMVGARLDSKNIIKLVDKLEELSSQTQLPKNPMEVLELMFNVQKDQHKRLEKLEKIIKIELWQEKELDSIRTLKAETFAKKNKKQLVVYRRKILSLLKKKFNLARFNELPASRFDEAVDFLNSLTKKDVSK